MSSDDHENDFNFNVYSKYDKEVSKYVEKILPNHGITELPYYDINSPELKTFAIEKFLFTENEKNKLNFLDEMYYDIPHGDIKNVLYSEKRDSIFKYSKIFQSRFYKPIFYLPYDEKKYKRYKPYYNYILDPREEISMPKKHKFNTIELKAGIGKRIDNDPTYIFRCQLFSSFENNQSYSNSYSWVYDVSSKYCKRRFKTDLKEMVTYKLLDDLNLLVFNAETIKQLADLSEKFSTKENHERFKQNTGYGISELSHSNHEIGGTMFVPMYSYINKPKSVIRFIDAGVENHFSSNKQNAAANFPQIHESVEQFVAEKKAFVAAAKETGYFDGEKMDVENIAPSLQNILKTPPFLANKVFFKFVQFLLEEFKKFAVNGKIRTGDDSYNSSNSSNSSNSYNSHFYKKQSYRTGENGGVMIKKIDGIIFDPFLLLENERIDDYYVNEWNAEIILFDPLNYERKIQRTRVNPDRLQIMSSQSNMTKLIMTENEKMGYSRKFEKKYTATSRIFIAEMYEKMAEYNLASA